MSRRLTAVLFLLVSSLALAQTTTRIEGTVSDAQGAVIPGAQVKVTSASTGQVFETSSDERGYWVVPALSTGTYKVTISSTGFKAAAFDNIKLDASVPARLNATLQIGAVTESVEVSAGAEIMQTATATVTNTLVGRQLHELPFTSRNLSELIVTQPGSATPGVPRSTSVYGLPQSGLNVSMDGMNIQDNSNRSGDGFFNSIFPRSDMVEEMTITSAAAGADTNAEGAVHMKMVTKSGTNQYHGLLFEQHRNQYFNANYYYNNILRQPRDHVVFNQFGGSAGGPIIKNKVFFFVYMEYLQLPQTYTEPTGTVLTPQALAGNFRYFGNGAVQTINLLQLAASKGFPGTADPLIAKTLGQIASLTNNQPGLTDRITSASDYNRNNLDFQSKGGNYRRFPNAHFDWNINSKNHLDLVYTYQTNIRRPDGVNIGTASPVFPGTQNVLNGTEPGNQGGLVFQTTASLRTTVTSRITNEARFGLSGGTVVFNNGVNASDFAQWNGFAPVFNFVTNPYRTTGQTRRNTPLKQGYENVTWSKGAHLIGAGMSFTQVNTWTTSANGTQFIPTATLGAIASGDPVSGVFVAANMPGSVAAQQTDALNLYTLLAGRVSSVNRSVILDEETRKYGNFQPIVRNQQREIGIYVNDSWHVRPGLTVNFGIRWDDQRPSRNIDGVYTRPGYAGLWGPSGVGNIFAPGVLTGSASVYNAVDGDATGFANAPLWAPSGGIAWVLPKTENKLISWLLGKDGSSVLRAGYAISSIREDASTFTTWAGNQGRTITLNVDPVNYPQNFGTFGAVQFASGNLPSRPGPTTPSFPLATAAGNNVSDYDPNLKIGYVQSWNLGFQRALTKDMVLEIRYVGNHGTKLWRNVNINEVNILENGFLNEFKIAQSNLALARATTPTSNQYAGLAGQQPLPIIATALASNTDATSATQIAQAQAGALANAIATNATRMARLTAAGRPANLFQVNPLGGGTSTVTGNFGSTSYDGLQVEVRRRFSNGLLAQGSYVWSHSIANEFVQGIGAGFTTIRDYNLDKSPSPYDVRQALKMNWIYELPFGPGRHYLGSVHNAFARKALEGWGLASVGRISSGSPIRLTSGRATFNQNESGVVLYNMTMGQLQDQMQIRKTTNASGNGIVYYLPQALIDKPLAAFELGGKTLANLDKNQPYIGPPTTPGQLGSRLFLYGPRSQKWDFSVIKNTRIGEKYNLEFRAQALNAFNLTNFLLFVPGNGLTTNLAVNSNTFGQLASNSAYRDLPNTNDTGGRILEFQLRFTF